MCTKLNLQSQNKMHVFRNESSILRVWPIPSNPTLHGLTDLLNILGRAIQQINHLSVSLQMCLLSASAPICGWLLTYKSNPLDLASTNNWADPWIITSHTLKPQQLRNFLHSWKDTGICLSLQVWYALKLQASCIHQKQNVCLFLTGDGKCKSILGELYLLTLSSVLKK